MLLHTNQHKAVLLMQQPPRQSDGSGSPPLYRKLEMVGVFLLLQANAQALCEEQSGLLWHGQGMAFRWQFGAVFFRLHEPLLHQAAHHAPRTLAPEGSAGEPLKPFVHPWSDHTSALYEVSDALVQ